VGVVLGLVAYLLPLYGLVPGRGPAGMTDRTPGILFARHRQAHLDAVADEQPASRPFAPAVFPAAPPGVAAPEPAESRASHAAPRDVVSRRPSPGAPRSPPTL
jgi:hypothetical protein